VSFYSRGNADLALQHRALVHPDGSECRDGCDVETKWCQCQRPRPAGAPVAGWVVYCGKCRRPIDGAP
jgi:hypothetical protein